MTTDTRFIRIHCTPSIHVKQDQAKVVSTVAKSASDARATTSVRILSLYQAVLLQNAERWYSQALDTPLTITVNESTSQQLQALFGKAFATPPSKASVIYDSVNKIAVECGFPSLSDPSLSTPVESKTTIVHADTNKSSCTSSIDEAKHTSDSHTALRRQLTAYLASVSVEDLDRELTRAVQPRSDAPQSFYTLFGTLMVEFAHGVVHDLQTGAYERIAHPLNVEYQCTWHTTAACPRTSVYLALLRERVLASSPTYSKIVLEPNAIGDVRMQWVRMSLPSGTTCMTHALLIKCDTIYFAIHDRKVVAPHTIVTHPHFTMCQVRADEVLERYLSHHSAHVATF